MSTSIIQANTMFREWLKARDLTPWVAAWMLQYAIDFDRATCANGLHSASMAPFACLQRMGGMLGEW